MERTSRLVIVEENPYQGGWGGTVASIVADEGFELLDAPVRRVAAECVPLPFADALEDEVIPTVDKVVDAVRRARRLLNLASPPPLLHRHEGTRHEQRKLIRGGIVLSMDPQIGDLTRGDVLIEDDRIAAVQPEINADAEVIDATGLHRDPRIRRHPPAHLGVGDQRVAPNATLDDYFVEILDTFAPVYRPEDVYASNLAGALECLNAGITTLVDWSHINNTPEHPDAAIRALQESGIRAQYAYGSANTSLADYWFESKIADPRRRRAADPGDLLRLRRRAAHHGPGHPRARLLRGRRGPAEWDARPRTRHPDHRARRRWAGWPAGSA